MPKALCPWPRPLRSKRPAHRMVNGWNRPSPVAGCCSEPAEHVVEGPSLLPDDASFQEGARLSPLAVPGALARAGFCGWHAPLAAEAAERYRLRE